MNMLKSVQMVRMIMNSEDIDRLMFSKFKLVYSERLGRRIYVLKTWLDEPVFLRHKKLFAYTDRGWSVRYPYQLIRALVTEGVWEI